MIKLKRFLCALLVFSLGYFMLYSQTYYITENQLAELEKQSETQKNEIAKLKAELITQKTLEIDLQNQLNELSNQSIELQKALNEAEISLIQSETKNLRSKILIGAGGLLLGFLSGGVATLICIK